MIQQFFVCVHSQSSWSQGLRYLYTQGHRVTVHNCLKLEAAKCLSVDEGKTKQVQAEKYFFLQKKKNQLWLIAVWTPENVTPSAVSQLQKGQMMAIPGTFNKYIFPSSGWRTSFNFVHVCVCMCECRCMCAYVRMLVCTRMSCKVLQFAWDKSLLCFWLGRFSWRGNSSSLGHTSLQGLKAVSFLLSLLLVTLLNYLTSTCSGLALLFT